MDKEPVLRFHTCSKAIASQDNVKFFLNRVAFDNICCI